IRIIIPDQESGPSPGEAPMNAIPKNPTTRPRTPLALAIAAALACATTAPVMAQEASAQGQATQAEDEATDLGTVVVTANKRVENVREVAAAISVIGERELENIGANSLADYADL